MQKRLCAVWPHHGNEPAGCVQHAACAVYTASVVAVVAVASWCCCCIILNGHNGAVIGSAVVLRHILRLLIPSAIASVMAVVTSRKCVASIHGAICLASRLPGWLLPPWPPACDLLLVSRLSRVRAYRPLLAARSTISRLLLVMVILGLPLGLRAAGSCECMPWFAPHRPC